VPADADGVLLPLLRQARRVDPAKELPRFQLAAAPEMRWAAWLHAVSGDSAQAEHFLLQARLAPDDHGESWFAIALLRLAREDTHGAREAFVAAARARFPFGEQRRRVHAELRAYDAGENRFAALQIFDETFDNAFRCFVMLQPVRPAEHKAYEACVSLACAWLGHSAATAAILEHDRAINGYSIWYHVNLGHFDWLAGRRDEADRHYRCAREIAIRDKLSPCHFNAGAVIWLTTAESERLLTGPPSGRETPLASGWSDRFGMPCSTPPEIAFVVGCDGNYFSFFPKFLLSVLRAYHAGSRGRQAAVHCHVADPKPGQIEFLRWAADWLGAVQPGVKLSFGSSVSAHRLGAYYTCLRFLALPAVMDWHETGVLAMDIDSELDPDFFEHLDVIRRHDAGLRMYSFSPETKRQVGGEPWSIGAHPTYLAHTAVGRRFAAFLAAYIDAAYDANSVANWTIDQCAIARAYDLILRPSIEGDTGEATVLNFAFQPSISRLPEAGKTAFLNEGGGVTTGNFAALAAAYTNARNS
jgi:tetratricopeptide (TPR) repeat protein